MRIYGALYVSGKLRVVKAYWVDEANTLEACSQVRDILSDYVGMEQLAVLGDVIVRVSDIREEAVTR